jgi:flagellar biosynthesis protein FlhB
MATSERTEKPTPQRRRKARGKGQVARSPELSAAVALLGAIVALRICAPWLWATTIRALQAGLQARVVFTPEGVAAAFRGWLQLGLMLLAPLTATALLLALSVNLAQTGMLLTTYPLRWDPDRINPAAGLRRLFSTQSTVQALKSSAKIALLLLVTGLTLRGHVGEILSVGTRAPADALNTGVRVAWDVALKCGVVLLAIGVIDYAYQRYVFERSLMMSRPELQQETRETEGDPQIQAQRRRRRQALLEGGISRELPQASVVIVNPTHIAIALRYTPQMAAPTVVAKGRGELAHRVVRYARMYGVPVHQDQTLARMMYPKVRVGQPIPPSLYMAVAEVLAIILRKREALARRYRS